MNTNPQAGSAAFHAGEVLLQETAGLAEKMAEIGPRVVRRYMPEQHREFFSHLPYVVVGALDAQRQPWATILHGAPGFIVSPSPATLHIAAQPQAHDPLTQALHIGAPVGLLGFEAHTRRRNRANGLLTSANEQGFVVQVAESFGNCPKYIQAREASPATLQAAATTHDMRHLDDNARTLINHADTLFIASAHPEAGSAQSYGVDVSHRGGKPGFVKIERSESGKDRLLLPDFAGNFFFNTFGNIALNPRVGLLFIDYAGHSLLHVAGHASLLLDGPTVEAYAGAERVLSIEVDSAIWRSNALPLQWTRAEPSPHLEHTGHW
jgi:uncharacterized protein